MRGTVKRYSSAALGQGLIPHQRKHTKVSLSYFRDTETATGEKLTFNKDGMLTTSTEIPVSWNQKVGNANSHSAHYQPIRRMSAS